ncbi:MULTISPECIES: DUF255 domain-containing protein [Streptomyces]|uniref:DUF255 domain-containing protein n=1 Tax=Streptomyces TaxID=1883 RepID=UPI002FC5DD60
MSEYGRHVEPPRNETSSYLLQHADNRVEWWPWSAADYTEARERGYLRTTPIRVLSVRCR